MGLSNFALFFLIGFIGYLVFFILGASTPALLGALTMVGLARLIGLDSIGESSYYLNIFAQIFLGLYVGVGVTRKFVKQVYRLLAPIALVSFWSIAVTVCIGAFLSTLTSMDLLTSLLGASPGGVAEMAIMAYSIGADVASVSLFQLFRLVPSIIVIPIIAKRRTRLVGADRSIATLEGNYITLVKANFKNVLKLFSVENINMKGKIALKIFTKPILLSVLIATLGAYIGIFLQIPGGGMVGALLATSIGALLGMNIEIPPLLFRRVLQICIGILIGDNFTRDLLYEFYDMLVPVIVFAVLIFGAFLILAQIVRKLTGWDNITCLLATAPAGLTAMTMLAYEMDSNPVEVSMMQLSRLLTVRLIIPIVIVLFKVLV
jgi:membrane AbrB-like protein